MNAHSREALESTLAFVKKELDYQHSRREEHAADLAKTNERIRELEARAHDLHDTLTT